ncbi:cytochrome c5 family protein [Pseudomonas cavernae]|uniref:Cytochrome c5 family protein n=1 Tax=Pseudomonas cavernae TaxID=2320867 RepID=A0A385YZ63_9PSED|nr:c-type cytochrome [Pseudomonas cavernae]AYC30938.1 cytochrome c5 family protein [Pseudomonas cavernae]
MKLSLLAATSILLACSAQAAQDPEAVFSRACGACHAGQLPMAPKQGDTAAWKPRLDQGMDTLVQRVTTGFNAMPPGGLCTDCSAADYQAVIEWMAR